MWRYKKYLLLICSMAVLSPLIYGQNYHFSNLHENLYIFNPASISRTNKISVILTYRNQWPGNSDFVNYNGAIFIGSEKLNSTVGLHVMRDVQGGGVITSDYISLIYSFKTMIGRFWEFSGGLQGAYNIYSTNFSGEHFEGGQLPPVTLDERITSYDFSTGFEFKFREKAVYGISLSKIGSILPANDSHQDIQLNLSYEGSFNLQNLSSSRQASLQPLVYSAIHIDYGEFLYGTRLDYDYISGGLYLRQNHRFQYDAIIILLGTRFGKMALYYTYDINLSGSESHFSKFAAHEVTFLYDMQYKRKSSKRGAIKCPKI